VPGSQPSRSLATRAAIRRSRERVEQRDESPDRVESATASGYVAAKDLLLTAIEPGWSAFFGSPARSSRRPASRRAHVRT